MLLSIFLEDYTSIVSSETERVAQSCTHLTLLRLVEGVVEVVVDLRIAVVVLAVPRFTPRWSALACLPTLTTSLLHTRRDSEHVS
jgi:hypothetical protein